MWSTRVKRLTFQRRLYYLRFVSSRIVFTFLRHDSSRAGHFHSAPLYFLRDEMQTSRLYVRATNAITEHAFRHERTRTARNFNSRNGKRCAPVSSRRDERRIGIEEEEEEEDESRSARSESREGII